MDELVYSTEGNKKSQKNKKNKDKSNVYRRSEGPMKTRLERKGRGGKAVTVLFDLPFDLAGAQELKKQLQEKFACGATFKNSVIELRGDFRQQIVDWGKEHGLTVKLAGG